MAKIPPTNEPTSRGRSQRSRLPYWKMTPRPREPPSYGQERRKARRDLAPGCGGRTDLVRTMGKWKPQQCASTEMAGRSSADTSVQDERKCLTLNSGQSQSPSESSSQGRRRYEHTESPLWESSVIRTQQSDGQRTWTQGQGSSLQEQSTSMPGPFVPTASMS